MFGMMFTNSKTFLAVLLIVLTPAVCLAADGDLDLTFGVGGKVTTHIGLGSGSDLARDVIACQADGKIVIVGSSFDSARENIAVARYHPDGSLDTTFGSDGTVITDLGSTARAHSVAVQADGRIVVVGRRFNAITVLRYLSDGSLDPSFGIGGVVQINIGAFSAANDVAIQPDGKIVVVGDASFSNTSVDFALVRLLPNGSLDTSFGVGGVVTIDFSTSVDRAQAVSIQADGRIVVAGHTLSGTPTFFDFALARYNADGSLDTSFGVGGLVTTDFGSAGANDLASDVAIQPDGKLVVAGFTTFVTLRLALARYNPDGSLDTAFGNFVGNGGLYLGTLRSTSNSVAIQPDGRIISAGSFGRNFAMERLNPDGSRDLSFGSFGRVITDFDPGTFFGSSVTEGIELLPDGRIVLGGSVRLGLFPPTGGDFALARYLPDGSLDLTFGIDGLVTTDFLQETHDIVFDAIAVQPDGKIVVIGQARSGVGADFAVVRYAADGNLDLTFGDGGVITTDINLFELPTAVAIQPDSKIVVVGITSVDELRAGRFDFILVRYNSDGSLDGTFGTGGIVTTDFGSPRNDVAFAVVIQSDGKLVVAGRSGSPQEFALARYNPDGTLDVTFGTGGLVTTGFGPTVFGQFATDLAIQADGKYVVTGRDFTGPVARLARYNPDGTLDASFGSGGLVTSVVPSGANRVVILDDGKILTIGTAIGRYNADGSLDTSFGNGGFTVTGLSGIGFRPGAALQPDGKILVAALAFSPTSDFGLARFNADGSPDTSFGTNGLVTTDFEFGNDGATALALHGGTGVVVGGFAEIGDPPGFDFALVRYRLESLVVDSDADGLLDDDEVNIHGTDPNNPDTDGDGLLDGTEVQIAVAGCPDPLVADSDADGLSDGFEVNLGTNPCQIDTDGDGLNDGLDDLPTQPGASSGLLEDLSREVGANVRLVDVTAFNGPNTNANKGRRNALANRATEAANLIAQGDILGAIDELTSLLEKVDGQTPPPDWMDDEIDDGTGQLVPNTAKTDLAAEVNLLIALLLLA